MPLNVTDLRGRRATERFNRASVGDIYERIRWSDPDREVLVCTEGAYESPQNARLTAARADDLANGHANAVMARAITPGSVVMMICDNSAEAILCKLGLAKAGVTVAPVNPGLGADVLADLVALCQPKGLIAEADYADLARGLSAATGVAILHWINAGAAAAAAPQQPSFAQFIADAPLTEPEVGICGDDIWQLLFTSGSTSTPKAVMQSHHNLLYTASAFLGAGAAGLRGGEGARVMAFLPMIFHVGDAFVFMAALSGGCFILGRRMNAALMARTIHAERVTLLWAGSPRAVEEITQEVARDPALSAQSLRTVIFGWAPMSPAVRGRILQTLRPDLDLVAIIGQTEVCAAHRFWINLHEGLYCRTSPAENYIGMASPFMGSVIADDAGTPQTKTAAGEALYRSPALMAGYYRREADSREALRDGWFHGGDAFRQGEQGQRIMADRIKDIVKSGGENVSSLRVEAVLATHPDVLKCAVAGLPHARWGEAVTAFVVLHPESRADAPALLAYASANLAPHERPKACVFVDALPETIGGKVQKHRLRDEHRSYYTPQPPPPG